MHRLRLLAVGSAIVLATAGCGIRDRRWGGCAIGGALVGGAVGGAIGGAAYNNSVDDAQDDERGAAIGAGIGGGAAIGALLGHALCDPIDEPPPPPPAAPPPPAPAPAAPAPGTKLGTVGSAFFDFDRATVKAGMREGVIDEVVRVMKQQPSLRVVVEGHADSVGSDAYNMKLSERRAQAVKAYLVREGIDASRIDTKGLGESKPVASNETAAGRAQNRRAEIIAE